MASFAWLVVLCAAAVAAKQDFLRSGRIVGGQDTDINKYPGIVQVDFRSYWTGIWTQQCAASILTSKHLVSASHCFEGYYYIPDLRRIRAGSSTRNEGGVIHYVDREFNHPSYGDNEYDYDITVITLMTRLEYTSAIQPITIPTQGSFIPANLPVVHAGWGATTQGGVAASVLQEVTIYTVDLDLCRDRYAERNFTVTENMICAGILDVGGKDACQGDSGGPLYYGDILVGVVSWGFGCAHPYFPGVSAKVSSFTDHIIKIVNETQ